MESSRQSGQRVSERLTTAERCHNLPELLTALVGRERDVVEVAQRLGTTRLLSLIGAGGIGKTRLALSVGIEVVPRYPAGVWLVELASLTDPTTIPRAIAASLGVYEEPARELTTTIADAVRSRRPLLLILDNCEHLIVDVAIIVDRLLRACPGLTILATSCEALGITGETAWRVPSLLLPPDPLPIGADAVATLAEHGAARLFLDRARDVQADFVVSEQNAHVIIQICRRLDGIPLAIELAAARARVLTPRQIAARLDDRFRLLTDSSRTADSRQRTLRSTIDWSYTLLSGAERVVLQRLSVFAGGCTLEAIEAICRDDADPIPDDVLDLVTRLADRSLVVVDLSGAEARYRLLETIRAYAVERLEASGEAERIRQRHAGYFLTLAELAGPQVRFADGRRWLDQLQFEHENLHAALARGAGAFDDRNLMPRMAGALWWYWHARGHLTEGRHWLGQALDVVVDPAVRLTVLYGAGTLAFHQDDYPQARECALESVALGRATGDQRAVAWALARLGIIARRVGDLEQAMAYCDEGLGLSRQLGDAETIAHTLIACGQVVRGLGDYEQADSYWEECLQLARVAGQTLFQSQTLVFRAAAAVVLGDLDRAETLCSEALALIRQREDRFQQIHPLEILVRVAKQRADVDRVAGLARDIGGGYSELGNRGGVALAASALAWVAHVCGDGPRAARLLGASDAVIAASGRVRTPGVIK